MKKQNFYTNKPFKLEKGGQLPDLTIAYHTLGQLNANGDNVVWICHAFTAHSHVGEWWDGMIGAGKIFDPRHHFIVCANILGSCYGTTGPVSVNPVTGEPYYHDFPEITIRDMVRAHELLREHLGIQHISLITGGSIGSFQALEWSIMESGLFDHLVVIAGSAKSSPWAIALNESQRMAIEADPTYRERSNCAGLNGMKAARSIALLSYRNYQAYGMTQDDRDDEKLGDYKARSYQQYQGEKLARRFNAFSYRVLSRAFDSHNLGRGRKSPQHALSLVRAQTLVVGISTDILFPADEQRFLAHHIPKARYVEIDSKYGHDGFLIETSKLTRILKKNLKSPLQV
ncbi:MAG: homoserine O-acetyltransferase [Bacteroidales bacterium]|nr:homoserine O-acetyltransferase [Bacteroidales bacterium]